MEVLRPGLGTSGLGLAWRSWTAALWHVVRRNRCFRRAGPLGAAGGGPAFDATQCRQQETVELAGVGSSHAGVDVEAFRCCGDGAPDELFEQRSNRAGAVRADLGDETKVDIGHSVSLSAARPAPSAAVHHRRSATIV